MSETVRRYTRDAALEAPSTLVAIFTALSGLLPAEVPPSPPSEPEPDPLPAGEWIMNARTGMYHLPSPEGGRARCGWLYAETGVPGASAPPWYFITCKQCAPAHRRRLKAEAANDAAEVLAAHPEPTD